MTIVCVPFSVLSGREMIFHSSMSQQFPYDFKDVSKRALSERCVVLDFAVDDSGVVHDSSAPLLVVFRQARVAIWKG